MARGRAHSDETKAAVMAALLAGQGVTEVAKEYNLSPSLVSGWKKSMGSNAFEEVRTKKEGVIEEKLLAYLGANLDALVAQSRVASDETYLRKYPPQQLAVLHGVMADKGIRLLEALSSAGSAADKNDDTHDADSTTAD